MSDHDKWEGKGQQAGGKIQEKVGEMTGDRDMERSGEENQGEGKVKEAWGNVKEKAGDLKDKVTGH